MNQKPSNTDLKQHPMASLALSLLSRGVDEPLQLDKKAVAKLEQELAGLFGRPELGEAVLALVMLAEFMAGELKAPKASQVLLAIAETAVAALNANKPPQALDQLRSAAGRFARFGGEKARREATPVNFKEPATKAGQLIAARDVLDPRYFAASRRSGASSAGTSSSATVRRGMTDDKTRSLAWGCK